MLWPCSPSLLRHENDVKLARFAVARQRRGWGARLLDEITQLVLVIASCMLRYGRETGGDHRWRKDCKLSSGRWGAGCAAPRSPGHAPPCNTPRAPKGLGCPLLFCIADPLSTRLILYFQVFSIMHPTHMYHLLILKCWFCLLFFRKTFVQRPPVINIQSRRFQDSLV